MNDRSVKLVVFLPRNTFKEYIELHFLYKNWFFALNILRRLKDDLLRKNDQKILKNSNSIMKSINWVRPVKWGVYP